MPNLPVFAGICYGISSEVYHRYVYARYTSVLLTNPRIWEQNQEGLEDSVLGIILRKKPTTLCKLLRSLCSEDQPQPWFGKLLRAMWESQQGQNGSTAEQSIPQKQLWCHLWSLSTLHVLSLGWQGGAPSQQSISSAWTLSCTLTCVPQDPPGLLCLRNTISSNRVDYN